MTELTSSWRETDEQDTDRETVLRDMVSGQYAYPLKIVAFNAIEGRCRDATEELPTRSPIEPRVIGLDLASAGGVCSGEFVAPFWPAR